jgi:hypothetical protein
MIAILPRTMTTIDKARVPGGLEVCELRFV